MYDMYFLDWSKVFYWCLINPNWNEVLSLILGIVYCIYREDRYSSLRLCVGEMAIKKFAGLKLFMVCSS